MTTHSVDPARFRWGTWCHRTDKMIAEGDIAASYSADRIGMGQPVSKPFLMGKACFGTCVNMGTGHTLHFHSIKGLFGEGVVVSC